MAYVCKHCGYKSSSTSMARSSCSKSPTGSHVIMQEQSKYVCKHCGHKSSSSTTAKSSCRKSPTGSHEWLD
jgi:DNA-directed RNA polymerase subunit RPC12/RpoP